jgi:tellurite resistance protein TehA-like permease
MTVNGELRQVPGTVSAPQIALPPIAPPVTAAAAPDLGPSTVLRSNDSSVASPSAFIRLVEIQVAWLTTLLVGFALLLTQFRRQYRRPIPSTPAPTKPSRRRRQSPG